MSERTETQETVYREVAENERQHLGRRPYVATDGAKRQTLLALAVRGDVRIVVREGRVEATLI